MWSLASNKILVLVPWKHFIDPESLEIGKLCAYFQLLKGNYSKFILCSAVSPRVVVVALLKLEFKTGSHNFWCLKDRAPIGYRGVKGRGATRTECFLKLRVFIRYWRALLPHNRDHSAHVRHWIPSRQIYLRKWNAHGVDSDLKIFKFLWDIIVVLKGM